MCHLDPFRPLSQRKVYLKIHYHYHYYYYHHHHHHHHHHHIRLQAAVSKLKLLYVSLLTVADKGDGSKRAVAPGGTLYTCIFLNHKTFAISQKWTVLCKRHVAYRYGGPIKYYTTGSAKCNLPRSAGTALPPLAVNVAAQTHVANLH